MFNFFKKKDKENSTPTKPVTMSQPRKYVVTLEITYLSNKGIAVHSIAYTALSIEERDKDVAQAKNILNNIHNELNFSNQYVRLGDFLCIHKKDFLSASIVFKDLF